MSQLGPRWARKSALPQRSIASIFPKLDEVSEHVRNLRQTPKQVTLARRSFSVTPARSDIYLGVTFLQERLSGVNGLASVGRSVSTALAVAAIGLAACGGVSADVDDVDATPGGQDAAAGVDAASDAAPAIAGALTFDGVNDVVLIPPNAVMDSAAFTIEFWVLVEESNFGGMVARWTSANTQLWRITLDDAGVVPRIIGVSGQEGSNFTNIADNVWQHVAVTVNDSRTQTMINGQTPEFVNFAGPPAEDENVNLEFGINRNGVNISFLSGTLDEVRLWDRVLTQAEVDQNRIREIDPNTTGLIGYWRFNEAPGDQLILDSGPNALHGTLGATNVDATDDPMRVTSNAPLAAF